MKKTIYMNDPLYKLNEQTQDGSFSRRLGEIVERYDIIMRLTPEPPEFTPAEMHVLGEVLAGAKISTALIYSLGFEVQDSVLETQEIREALAKKINAMTAAEKVKMIEKFFHHPAPGSPGAIFYACPFPARPRHGRGLFFCKIL